MNTGPGPAWWRISGWPTADEWQALAAVLTLLFAAAALAFTLRQLKLGREANELAAAAADRTAEAAEAEARPYVSVSVELMAIAPSDPKSSASEGMAYIVVQSVGRTPGRNIRLKADPPFQTSGRGKVAEGPDFVQDALDTVFSGTFEIGMLGPGQSLRYLLDFAKEAVDPTSSRPKRYTVTATYSDPNLDRTYVENSIVDLAPLGTTILQIDPLETIARQFRRLNEKGLP